VSGARSGVIFRTATIEDLPAVLAMLMDDELGKLREDVSTPLNPAYLAAFEALDRDPNQLLVVAERDGTVVGTCQLSFLAGLSHQGMWRGQIEGVRIASSERGSGLGKAMMAWVIAQCRARGCGLLQLTTDKRRKDAHRFYEHLGFVASHEGMKLRL